MTDADCLFCRIARGELPASVLHEDDEVLIVRDIDAKAPTHLLAIPRRHIGSVHELTDDDAPLLGRLFGALRRAATDARLANGYRIVTNVGPDAGQSVPHLHLHLLGGRQMAWPPG